MNISPVLLYTALLKKKTSTSKMEEKIINLAQEPRQIVSCRNATGGTSPETLKKNILSLNQSLKISRKWLTDKRKQQATAQDRLAVMERNL